MNDEAVKALKDVVAFPDCAATNPLRHYFILRRRPRPVVPCPEHTPLPKRGETTEERAKKFSVYLRPWTLLPECASAVVPHLRDLNLMTWISSRKRGKTDVRADEATPERSFRKTWRRYIDGNIVSYYDAGIIKSPRQTPNCNFHACVHRFACSFEVSPPNFMSCILCGSECFVSDPAPIPRKL